MKKDIPFLPVEGICIAVSRYIESAEEISWKVFLINKNSFAIENVFIRSKGYGFNEEGEKQETSTLRHHIPEVAPGEYALIEPIDPGVFHLNNEYWVSYFVSNQVYDKKFIFVPDTIVESNLIFIPQINMEGVLHI
ncbi:MAG TPA: hypothetical protein VK766_00750 [Cytophagaceae bacterium]|jgi:hypothetical protein|nr:hypothetical protein [Cytophagaceae bacterium]